jgi:flagellar L-ring protein precursor FlgH
MTARALPRLLAFLAMMGLLAGCSAWSRVSQIGEKPPLTVIQNPVQQPGYRPISLPMPAPNVVEHRPNSLWQAGTRAFFKDQRASQVGDILTIVVNIDEKAKLDNETQRSRDDSETSGVTNMFGFERQLQRILPHAANPASLLNASGTSTVDGKGSIDRKEQIRTNVAAIVTQRLPNGNLVVQGRQEVRVNYEVRELQVTGVLRPQDISSTNTVTLDKLAEARVSYGGRGQITDVQQPRYGQQLFDVIAPF